MYTIHVFVCLFFSFVLFLACTTVYCLNVLGTRIRDNSVGKFGSFWGLWGEGGFQALFLGLWMAILPVCLRIVFHPCMSLGPNLPYNMVFLGLGGPRVCVSSSLLCSRILALTSYLRIVANWSFLWGGPMSGTICVTILMTSLNAQYKNSALHRFLPCDVCSFHCGINMYDSKTIENTMLRLSLI